MKACAKTDKKLLYAWRNDEISTSLKIVIGLIAFRLLSDKAKNINESVFFLLWLTKSQILAIMNSMFLLCRQALRSSGGCRYL